MSSANQDEDEAKLENLAKRLLSMPPNQRKRGGDPDKLPSKRAAPRQGPERKRT